MRRTLIACLLLAGCNTSGDTPADPIERHSSDASHFPLPTPLLKPTFPWRNRPNLAPISAKHFRCKGSTLNSGDCGGVHEHGLPFIEEKESVYPALVDILNFIQQKTQKQVIITSGHRCPKHNKYADPSSYNETSKHQIGAEVDFYVEGMKAKDILPFIFAYYENQEESFRNFRRYDQRETNVSTLPWFNKEIFIKLYLPYEGRDKDNNHDKSYLGIQVRWDKDRDERVVYTWKKARQYARL